MATAYELMLTIVFVMQLSSVAFTACAWYTTTYLGVDRHTWDVPVTSFSDAAKVRLCWLIFIQQ